jgi:hypothetical protein
MISRMRLRVSFQIATYVLGLSISTTALAAPGSLKVPSPLTKTSTTNSTETPVTEPASARGLEELDAVQLKHIDSGTVAIETEQKLTATRIVRNQSRTLAWGVATGSLTETTAETNLVVSLNLQNNNANETAQLFGIEILGNTGLGFHLDYQSFCCLGKYAEPFLGFGVGWWSKSSNALAKLAEVQNYHFRAKLGFEDLFRNQRRVKLELVSTYGALGPGAEILLGWNFDKSETHF